jgi:hypothetical protein
MTNKPATAAPLDPANEPGGDLCIRTLAMPADTNANGDIFGGWLSVAACSPPRSPKRAMSRLRSTR